MPHSKNLQCLEYYVALQDKQLGNWKAFQKLWSPVGLNSQPPLHTGVGSIPNGDIFLWKTFQFVNSFKYRIEYVSMKLKKKMCL